MAQRLIRQVRNISGQFAFINRFTIFKFLTKAFSKVWVVHTSPPVYVIVKNNAGRFTNEGRESAETGIILRTTYLLATILDETSRKVFLNCLKDF